MEAPVPASALIHSATLVSAGIYLLLRFKPIIDISEFAKILFPVIGCSTALLGAVASAFQTDVKKILAYSTISHCGFLVVSSLICPIEFTLLYLYVHGFFKAASFICIGNVIRFNFGNQDLRCMGGFSKYLPFEMYALAISLSFLAGLPATFGFFMKHFLVASLPFYGTYYIIIYTTTLLAALFGVVYCSKLYYGIFFGSKRGSKHVYLITSRKVFFSFDPHSAYYTNSTLSGIFAIFGLIVVGIFINFVLIIHLYVSYFNFGDLNTLLTSTSSYNITRYIPKNLLLNFSTVNTFMFIILLCIVIISFATIFQYEKIFELLGLGISFFFFFTALILILILIILILYVG
jgi:NADH:ubiquinone oxidoreductase subunit 5 (subunit L)/multisubunit Na+/H+ antiporter MnhA subunit